LMMFHGMNVLLGKKNNESNSSFTEKKERKY